MLERPFIPGDVAPRLRRRVAGRRLPWALLALLAVPPGTPVRASAPAGERAAIRGVVAAGFDGYFRVGRCLPVRVTLTNEGPDVSGQIVVRLQGESYVQSVSLPSPSRKTLSFYVIPSADVRELEVLVEARGAPLITLRTPLRRLGHQEQLAIASSTLRSGPPARSPSSDPSTRARTVFIELGEFPERWSDYEAVDAVLLDSSDTARLGETQRSALRRWTLVGGAVSLLSRAGRGADETPGAGTTGPGNTSGVVTPYGLGSFRQTASLDAPFAAMEDSGKAYRTSLPDVDQEIFAGTRLAKPFSRTYLVWYTGAFLAVYGLALAASLRFLRSRRGWTFAAMAAIALMFSLLSPAMGWLAHAGNAPVRQLSLTHVFVNSVDLFTTNQVVLLSPRRTVRRLSPTLPAAYLVQDRREDSGAGGVYEFADSGVPTAAFDAPLWMTRLVSVAGFPAQGPFMALRGEDAVTLVNRSPFLLHECSWIRRGVATRIADLPAGQERVLDPGSFEGNDGAVLEGRPSAFLSRVVAEYENESRTGTMGDCVVCATGSPAPAVTSDVRDLSFSGSAAVVYHLGARQANAAESGTR